MPLNAMRDTLCSRRWTQSALPSPLQK
jgi:hypothetical protein